MSALVDSTTAPFSWCGSFVLGISRNSNLVGYQANAVPQGYAMVTPTFVNISGEDMPIDSVILQNVADGDATVQVVNPDGSWGTQGFWFNEYGDLPAGWFTDMSGLTPADITLKPGQAVFFYSAKSGGSVQTAGQVAEDFFIDLPQGYSMIGNASPIELPIDSITLDGVADGDATVQVVNPDGSWGTQGFWFNEYGDLPAGWFTDMSGLTPADITLTPGKSVFFYSAKTGGKAKIPSALK